MSAGNKCILRINEMEYQAAMAAIKLVRGNTVKNAYMEGWRDGWVDCAKKYRGEWVAGEAEAWEKSHAKATNESDIGASDA